MKEVKYLFLVTAAALCAAYTSAGAPDLTTLNDRSFWRQFQDGMRELEEAAAKRALELQKAVSGAIAEAEAALSHKEATARPHRVGPISSTTTSPAPGSVTSAAEDPVRRNEDSIPHAGLDGLEPEDSDDSDEDSEELSNDELDFDVGIPGIPIPNLPKTLLDNIFSKTVSATTGVVDWWKGPNVCVEQEEIDDESSSEEETDSKVNSTSHETSRRHQGYHNQGGFIVDFSMLADNYHFSSCSHTPTKYQCTTRTNNHGVRKTYTVTYRCCHGAQRQRGQPGCSEVNNKTVLQTAASLGAALFVKVIETSLNLRMNFENAPGNYTVFAPIDEALIDYMDTVTPNRVEMRIRRELDKVTTGITANEKDWLKMYDSAIRDMLRHSRDREGRAMESSPMDDPVSKTMANHQVMGIVDLNEARNEMLLSSASKPHGLIRINSFPGLLGRTWTVNCARVVKSNYPAVGGMVHVVDKVLGVVHRGITIASVLDSDPRLSTFRKLLDSHGLMDILRGDGPVTLFAPTNDAFFQMDDAMRKRLLLNSGCAVSILRQHIVRHTVCSAAAQTRVHAPNLEGVYLTLEDRPSENKLYINDAHVIDRDRMGANGVLHVIDKFIMPMSTRPLPEVMKSSNMTQWFELLEKAGVMDTIDNMSNVTLFVPTKKALMTPEAQKLFSNDSKEGIEMLKKTLLYHISPQILEAETFSDNKLIKTELAGESLRMKLYSTIPFLTGAVSRATVECGTLVSVDNKACGAVVHKVDRLLAPPTKTLQELIEERPDLSYLRTILNPNIYKEIFAENSTMEKRFTLLALTNKGFERMGANFVTNLQRRPDLGLKFIQTHLLRTTLCCSGVGASMWPFTSRVPTMQRGHTLKLQRDQYNRVYIGGAKMDECDIMATDGVMHIIERSIVTVPELIAQSPASPPLDSASGEEAEMRESLTHWLPDI